MKTLFCFAFIIACSNVFSQPNCEALLYYFKDTVKYEACKKAEEIEGYYQFSKEYQEILDEAIKIDPSFAYLYRKKSIAYLKSGDFITWKNLMDKAVELNPRENLDYRGLMRFRCFRDYKGAIEDFESFENSGFNSDHLTMAKALCYNAIGEKEKAVEIITGLLNGDDASLGLNDYLHYGIIHLELQNYQEALLAFTKQKEINDIAENQFYIALTRKALKLNYLEHLQKAKDLYIADIRMFQEYIDPVHKIYLVTIENELRASTY